MVLFARDGYGRWCDSQPQSHRSARISHPTHTLPPRTDGDAIERGVRPRSPIDRRWATRRHRGRDLARAPAGFVCRPRDGCFAKVGGALQGVLGCSGGTDVLGERIELVWRCGMFYTDIIHKITYLRRSQCFVAGLYVHIIRSSAVRSSPVALILSYVIVMGPLPATETASPLQKGAGACIVVSAVVGTISCAVAQVRLRVENTHVSWCAPSDSGGQDDKKQIL